MEGKTSHAGEPEEGKNPCAAIAELALYSQHSAAHVKNEMAMCTIIGMKSGTDDFGYFLKECPGAIFYIGNGETYPAVHTREYDFNDDILETAVDMFVKLVCSGD